MFWADAIETNMDRLRRYAAFTCGSFRVGDEIICGALEGLLSEVSSAEAANLPILFRRLDQALRNEPPCHPDAFADFGRWQFLRPLERRLVLLIVLEQFSRERAAFILGITLSEVNSLIGRARMKYADRFPVRVGVVGGDAENRQRIAAVLDEYGDQLLWSVEKGSPPAREPLEPPSAVVVIGETGDAPEAGSFPLRRIAERVIGPGIRFGRQGDFAGPVIVANDTCKPRRVSNQVWNIPAEDIGDTARFRSALVRALLFSS